MEKSFGPDWYYSIFGNTEVFLSSSYESKVVLSTKDDLTTDVLVSILVKLFEN